MRKFQIDKKISEMFLEYPECYLTCVDESDEAIFLEDLKPKDYHLFDRFAEMDIDHVSLVMKTYAKLHAVSFALKDQKHQSFTKIQQMPDWFEQRKDNAKLRMYFESLKTPTLQALDRQNDKSYLATLSKYFEQKEFYDLLLPLLNGKNCEPFAVVCHGDCWNNNLLFKYQVNSNLQYKFFYIFEDFSIQQSGAVVDLRLIDWQLMRYASPVTDLMYFLFTCTTKNFREQYFQKALDFYYACLATSIEKFVIDFLLLF